MTRGQRDHSDLKWFIIIGILLTLFAGSVALLFKSRMSSGTTAPREQPTPTQSPSAEEEPAAVGARPEGLPEGGSVELITEYDPADQSVLDQKIVWQTESEEIVLISSIRTVLPGLAANDEALFLFAKPTNAERVFYAANCTAACDSLPHDLIAFDPNLRAFIPLLNAPKKNLVATDLSQNQRRLAFGGPTDERGEIRELWIYDLVEDALSRPVTVAQSESLTAYTTRAEGLGPLEYWIEIAWKDPTQISYQVFRADGNIPEGFSRKRTPIATRTVQIAP